MKRHGYDGSRRRMNSTNLRDDSDVDVSHDQGNNGGDRQRKSLLMRPAADSSRTFHDTDRSFRHFNPRANRGSRQFNYNRAANNISKYSGSRQRFGGNNGSSRSSSNLQGPLGRIDPMLAAAAAAAVMNAGLIPPNSNGAAELAQLASGSANAGQSSSNAATSTVAAVAAAAMNVAAMAAAWGSGSISSRQLSQLTKSFSGGGGNAGHYRSRHSSNRMDRVRDNSPPMRSTLDDGNSRMKYDRDSVRFPHHLEHRKPEADHNATRTLFVGNLMPEITEADLRSVFEKFGLVEDIDIKCRDAESGVNAYAFVRFVNLDMAHRAKVEMSGKLIGQFACKIGYGKVIPTRCLWVGGLGPWITYPEFATLVEEFGPTEKIIWPSGKNYANILFPNVEMAIRAADALRGYPLGGENRRIRIDFTNEEHMNRDYAKRRRLANPHQTGRDDSGYRTHREDTRSTQSTHRRHKREYTPDSPKRSNPPSRDSPNPRRRQRSSRDRSPAKRRRRGSTPLGNCTPPVANLERSSDHVESGSRAGRISKHLNLQTAVTIDQLACCIPVAWEGAFFLKSSSFPCRMHIIRGDQSLVDQFMSSINNVDGSKSIPSDPDAAICLRITQRMKLDPIKLDDVSQRINAAGNSGFCVLLAVTSAPTSHNPGSDSGDSSKQPQRPLRNLISYLRTKDSAGVVLLSPGNIHSPSSSTSDGLPVTGVLHAFPPCDFAFDLLKDQAISLPRDYTKDDHLVILLIRSTNAL